MGLIKPIKAGLLQCFWLLCAVARLLITAPKALCQLSGETIIPCFACHGLRSFIIISDKLLFVLWSVAYLVMTEFPNGSFNVNLCYEATVIVLFLLVAVALNMNCLFLPSVFVVLR